MQWCKVKVMLHQKIIKKLLTKCIYCDIIMISIIQTDKYTVDTDGILI